MASGSPLIFYDLAPAPGTCPFAERAWIALVELNVPFHKKFVDKAHKSEEFLDLYREITQDPAGRGAVPTIIDGEYKLTESAVVAEYLDKKYGKPGSSLLPDDPQQYGLVKLFVETFTTHMVPTMFKLLKADTKGSLSEAVAAAENGAKIVNNFIQHNGSSAGGGFFLGSRYSFAETMTTSFLRRILILMPHFKKWDLQQYAETSGLHRLSAWIEASMKKQAANKVGCSAEQIISSFEPMNSPVKD